MSQTPLTPEMNHKNHKNTKSQENNVLNESSTEEQVELNKKQNKKI